MKQGTHICLYKRKGDPIITAVVKDNDAQISVSLEDFQKLLIQEIGTVTWVLRDKTFEQKLDLAIKNIVRGIKEGATVII